jgi:hypothetical protein
MSHRPPKASSHQAEYARLRALIDIRLAELVRALDAHERIRSNWRRSDPLVEIDRKVGEAIACLGGRDIARRRFGRYGRLRAAVARREGRSTRRATQRELRQRRLCEEVPPLMFRELMRELLRFA